MTAKAIAVKTLRELHDDLALDLSTRHFVVIRCTGHVEDLRDGKRSTPYVKRLHRGPRPHRAPHYLSGDYGDVARCLVDHSELAAIDPGHGVGQCAPRYCDTCTHLEIVKAGAMPCGFKRDGVPLRVRLAHYRACEHAACRERLAAWEQLKRDCADGVSISAKEEARDV